MLKSMTGFGRGEIRKNGFYINVEIKTVNHRFLDVVYRLPKLLSGLEDRIRNVITNNILRGRVEVNIFFETYDRSINTLEVDKSLLNQYFEIIKYIKQNYLPDENIKVRDILLFPEIIKVKSVDINLNEVWEVLKSALIDSINNLVDMRIREGIKLHNDICKNLDILNEISDKIEKRSSLMIDTYRDKLRSRIEELTNGDFDQYRLMTEVALMADRISIAEEITRLKSHIIQFKTSMESNHPVGKKLDFITQEMNREVNTIGAKSIDLEISNSVIDSKHEIEKIREQVQNIE
ncbi:MAG: YicC/YloC family endoribonuclease [Thermoanaerobacteraceae bacterium]|nr:YicC/YloC family endoribonuclease [Thermoanaerobacteraceae bacterium]